MTLRKYKLDYDIERFTKELDELFPLDQYTYFQQFPTERGTYHYDIKKNTLPRHLKETIERSLGFTIQDYYFLWDWRCLTTHLSKHRDDYDAATKTGLSEWYKQVFETENSEEIEKPLSVVVALENDFQIDVEDNDTGELKSLIYGPGDLIFFEHAKDYHSGNVLNDPENLPRRTLNCYVDSKILNNMPWLKEDKLTNVPMPKIHTPIAENGKQAVPLGTNYKFDDMFYLDTIEAYPLFETQASIIIEKQCKGIVDIGCRHGPVLEILEQKGYTDFQYIGFDTSEEPIKLAQEQWRGYNNIEFRCTSWDNLEEIKVDFPVDQVIWSGVLLYRPSDHFDFFKKLTCEFYSSTNAIIQEPKSTQRHWHPNLVLNTIDEEIDQYSEFALDCTRTDLDLEIFSGRRLILDLSL